MKTKYLPKTHQLNQEHTGQKLFLERYQNVTRSAQQRVTRWDACDHVLFMDPLPLLKLRPSFYRLS
jgi:hypothetical protein